MASSIITVNENLVLGSEKNGKYEFLVKRMDLDYCDATWDSSKSFASQGYFVSTVVLRIEKEEEEFIFVDIPKCPVPSLLHNYSAPVGSWADIGKNAHACLDKEFIAKAITLPEEGEIMDLMEVADPDAVHAVRCFVIKHLASELRDELLKAVENNRSSEPYDPNHKSMARRALKKTSLAYLTSLEDSELTELALHDYRSATNMTEQFAALAVIAQNPSDIRTEVLSDFYRKWEGDALVINKWLALQAMFDILGNVKNIQSLLEHPAF
eukprot:Gb_24385 [translate_table: standard]